MNEIIVYSTAGSLELARQISTALVEEREAACVNIVPGVTSIYRWEGKICEDGEFLLVIKTTVERFEAVRARILQLHTYQVPEVIATPIAAGDPRYLDWLRGSVADRDSGQ
jgi:periplasmic divalent cation tolerance protein